MTLAELRTEIRKLVPKSVSTCVRIAIWDYDHIPGDTPEVKVHISALLGTQCDQVDAPTAELALEAFKAQTLVALGLIEVPPPLDRLAEMERGMNDLLRNPPSPPEETTGSYAAACEGAAF